MDGWCPAGCSRAAAYLCKVNTQLLRPGPKPEAEMAGGSLPMGDSCWKQSQLSKLTQDYSGPE